MMFLGTTWKVGISTGISISLTEICPRGFSTNRLALILCQPQPTQVSQNNFKAQIMSLIINVVQCDGDLTSENRETHHELVKIWNVTTGVQTRFKIYCNCAPGDNPSQSGTSGHIGGKGNHPCQKCKLGGAQKVWETDDVFHASFYVWLPFMSYHLAYLLLAWQSPFIRWHSSESKRTSQSGVSWGSPDGEGFSQRNRCKGWMYIVLDWKPYWARMRPAKASAFLTVTWNPSWTYGMGRCKQTSDI